MTLSLIAALLIVGLEPAPTNRPVNLDAMSRSQLSSQLHLLEDARPGLLQPVMMITGGAALSVGATALAFIGMILSTIRFDCAVDCSYMNTNGNIMWVSGIVIAIAATVTAAIGHTRLTTRIEDRSKLDEAANAVRIRMQAVDIASGTTL